MKLWGLVRQQDVKIDLNGNIFLDSPSNDK